MAVTRPLTDPCILHVASAKDASEALVQSHLSQASPSPCRTLHAHVMLVEPNTGMVISKMLRLRLLDLDSLPDGKELFEALAEARQF